MEALLSLGKVFGKMQAARLRQAFEKEHGRKMSKKDKRQRRG
jgi:hypothetical protein